MWAWGMRGLVGLLAELAVGAGCCPPRPPWYMLHQHNPPECSAYCHRPTNLPPLPCTAPCTAVSTSAEAWFVNCKFERNIVGQNGGAVLLEGGCPAGYFINPWFKVGGRRLCGRVEGGREGGRAVAGYMWAAYGGRTCGWLAG